MSGSKRSAGAAPQEITQRRRGEEALARWEAIVQSTREAMMTIGVDGVITSWNSGAERIFGYTADEVVGRVVGFALASQDQGAEIARITEIILQGRAIDELETTRRTKDGRIIDVSFSLSPLRDPDGRIVGTTLIGRDITEQKRAQARLADAEERLRAAFDEASVGMVLLDADGRYVKVNDAFCAIVGYPKAHIEGSHFAQLAHPDDVEQGLENLRKLVASGRSYTAEKRYIHSSGQHVHAIVRGTLLRGPDGAVRDILYEVEDVTARRRQEQQLRQLADHDVLTGLLNRRAFGRQLEAHASMVERYGPRGAVLVIDLDHFKHVNDTLGPRAGDDLIARVARRLARMLRPSDVLARLGGDEFGVLLADVDPPAAHAAAGYVLEAVRAETIEVAGATRQVTASVGIALFGEGTTGEDALVRADLAMYDAKDEGRDRARRFLRDGGAPARTHGRITWMHRIQAALARDRFVLYAQPIVDLATGHDAHYELLLRMLDDRGELVPPDSFLDVAESHDLIREVDMWVVSHGLVLLGDLGPDHAEMTVEINLSAASLGDHRLLEHIQRELAAHAVDPGRVIFEITETASLTNLDEARAFAEQLSQLGCRFAIDDFGAGFGSFYYLKHLFFDLIKIDGEFVQHCATNETDQIVLKAIIDIARGLGKQTVAEYVEDADTAALLRDLGVDYGQGFHLGTPAPLAEHLAARSSNGAAPANGAAPPASS